MEQNREKIVRRLKKEGWVLDRNGKEHDIYTHSNIQGGLAVPRHKKLSPGVAGSIAKKAGWAR